MLLHTIEWTDIHLTDATSHPNLQYNNQSVDSKILAQNIPSPACKAQIWVVWSEFKVWSLFKLWNCILTVMATAWQSIYNIDCQAVHWHWSYCSLALSLRYYYWRYHNMNALHHHHNCCMVHGKYIPGPLFIKKTLFFGIGIPIMNQRQLSDHLRLIMGNPVPVKQHLFSE